MKHLAQTPSASASRSRRGLQSAFFRSDECRFSGFVVDTTDTGCKFAIEILVDGHPVRVIRADRDVHGLMSEGIGDGCYGFSCSLDEGLVRNSSIVEARLANLGIVIGEPIHLNEPPERTPPIREPATVRWLGGLRFSGWIDHETAIANVLVDGVLVTRVRASTWGHVGTFEKDARAVRTFDFHLPKRFADGAVHRLILAGDAGENVSSRSIVFIAYADGFREAIIGCGASEQERMRAELLDRLLPMSVPFSDYRNWQEVLPIEPDQPSASRCAVILAGPESADATIATLYEQTNADWVATSLTHSSGPTSLVNDEAQAFLRDAAVDCDLVVFALAGTLFAPSALQRIATAFAQFETAQAVYSDLDIESNDGSLWPLAFSAFDYERMLEQGYCAHLFALRRPTAERALAVGASNLYRVFNSVLDDDSVSHSEVVHIPGSLGTLPGFDRSLASAELAAATSIHLEHSGIETQTKPSSGSILPVVQITPNHELPSATIVIPTRNRLHRLQACIDSVLPALDRAKAELMIVDNDSADPATLAYLAEVKENLATVLHVPGEFNLPRLNNRAAKAARGEVLCFLNDDIEALDDRWLEEMLSRIAGRDVGAVGSFLVWPSGVVQHGGIVLGPGFSAKHAFNDRVDGDGGYSDLLRVAHECSAVSAACLVTRRRDYLDVGGMDEIFFATNFNDVDYCLKLRADGKRIVFTPHAKLKHFEPESRGLPGRPEQFERELQNLRAKWGTVLAADPYYSPMLSRDVISFSALAWPPAPMQPRTNRPPTPTEIPPGF